MSETQTNQRFQYGKMTEPEARHYLTIEYGEGEVATWEERNHFKNYIDVLYFSDAYGDLEDALLLQAFDKTVPDGVHKGLIESGWDIFEAVNCNDLDKKLCAGCDTEMYEIEINEGDGHTSRRWMDEYGNAEGDFLEYVDDEAGHIWNADREDCHAPVLCTACSHDISWDFPDRLHHNGSVVVHYGETDEVSAFGVWNGLVRWDFWSRYGEGNWTDLFWVPGDSEDLAHSFATKNVVEYMDSIGWSEISESQAMDALPAGVRGLKAKKQYRRLAEEWSEAEETNPDVRFTYLIDHASFGNPSFWVADEDREELMDVITDLIQRRA